MLSNFGRRCFSSVSRRPFNILGIQQIAVGGLDKSVLSKFWVDQLGLTRTGSYRSEKENVDEDILDLGSGVHKVEVDLMQPIDPNKSPKVHQPALNHIGLWVDNIEVAVEALTKEGLIFTPGGIRKGAAGFNVCFIHPKSAGGVLIELVQAPPEVIEAKKQK